MKQATWRKLTLSAAGLGLCALSTAALADRWTSPLESPDEQGRFILRVPSPDQLPERPLVSPDVREPIRRPLTIGDLVIQSGADLDPADLEEPLAKWADQPLSFTELQRVAAELVMFLRENGHPLAEIELLPGAQLGDPFRGLRLYSLTEPALDQAPTIRVESFVVEGVSVMEEAEVAAVLEPYESRDLTLQQLTEASGSLTQALRDRGYLLAEAFVPAQDIADGQVQISVREGVVDGSVGSGGITVEGASQRVRPQVVIDYLAEGVEPDAPLQADPLERAVSVLDRVPGISEIGIDLSPGSVPGSTQLTARVTEQSLVDTRIQADNFGSRFTGESRGGLSLSLNSPMGYGERFAADIVATDETERAELAVDLPLNRRGWRAGLSASLLESELDFTEIPETERISPDLRSRLRGLSLFTSYPLVASPRNNVSLTASLGQTQFERRFESFDAALDRDARMTTASVGLSGDSLDERQGQTRWSIGVTRGDLDLSAEPEDEAFDELTAGTAGGFTRTNASIGRLQSIDALPGNNWSIWASIRGQWADGNLDPGEKFQLGGPYGVRAYPVGEAAGDYGWLATAELRKLLINGKNTDLTGFVFYDFGSVTQYADSSELLLGDQPNNYELKGYGIGLSFSVSDRFDLRLIAARKDGDNPNPNLDGTDADGRDDETRGWIIGTLNF